jgi:hypothetical protein
MRQSYRIKNNKPDECDTENSIDIILKGIEKNTFD